MRASNRTQNPALKHIFSLWACNEVVVSSPMGHTSCVPGRKILSRSIQVDSVAHGKEHWHHNAESGYCNAPWVTEKVHGPFFVGSFRMQVQNFWHWSDYLLFSCTDLYILQYLEEIRIKRRYPKEISKEEDWPSSPCPSMHTAWWPSAMGHIARPLCKLQLCIFYELYT